jgi:prepilin-type N-terminal cleavage/methylation domain-containing protein
MARNVYANTKKAFSLIEFLVALAILTIISVALMNSIVFFTHKSIERKVVYLTSKVPEILKTEKNKLDNCSNRDACASFNNNCLNSLNCEHPDSCIVSVPENGKIYYYSINSTKIGDSDIYKVNICAKIFGKEIKKEVLISLPLVYADFSFENKEGNI